MAVRTKNIYKPRYSIALLSKTDFWINKTSRLRGFFNIRGRKLHRRGIFKRLVLVLNDMKWTVARRAFKPQLRKQNRQNRFKYKLRFYTKQQIRAFYGIYKEETFRNMFKYFIGGAKKNRSLFFCSLEARLDVFLYRLRFLPTIYASKQFIRIQGLWVNRTRNNLPATRVNPGDIVQFRKPFWFTFHNTIFDRIYWRKYGLALLQRRQLKKTRKRFWWVNKNRLFYKRSLFFLGRQKRLLWKFFKMVLNIRDFVFEFKKILNSLKIELINLTFNPNSLLFPLLYESASIRLKNKVKKDPQVIKHLMAKNWQHFMLKKKIISEKELKTFKNQISKVKTSIVEQFDFFTLSSLTNFSITWANFKSKVLVILNSFKTLNNKAVLNRNSLNRIKNIMEPLNFRKFSSITRKRYTRRNRSKWSRSKWSKRNQSKWSHSKWSKRNQSKRWRRNWLRLKFKKGKKGRKTIRHIWLNILGITRLKRKRIFFTLFRQVKTVQNLKRIIFWNREKIRINRLNSYSTSIKKYNKNQFNFLVKKEIKKDLTKSAKKIKVKKVVSIRKKFFSNRGNSKIDTPWKYSVLTVVSHTNLIFKSYRFLYFYLDLFCDLESTFYNQFLEFLTEIREMEMRLVKPFYLKAYSRCFAAKWEQSGRVKNYLDSTVLLAFFYERLKI